MSPKFKTAIDFALYFLKFRPRSEKEVRLRLAQKGFAKKEIETTILQLKKSGLIDDKVFAQKWVEWRDATSPRASRVLKLELKQKGVAEDIIEQMVSPEKDKMRIKKLIKQKKFLEKEKLAQFLARRGFGWEQIKETLKE